jgi:alpha-D-xyloside xylohydrolase
MVKYIHEQGYKLVLWHTSWINLKSDPPKEAGFAGKMNPMAENYQFAADQGLFVKNANGSPYVGRWWKGEGSLIDFTKPKAKEWWQSQVRQAIAAGADGFKDDDAEGAFFGADVRFADGTDPRVMRNRYGVLYNNAVEELIQKDLKGNGVLFARSVTVGANGIGFLWGGDNEASFSPLNGLPTVVTAGLGAGLSGMPLWAADLGGYLGTADTPNARLLERWTEYSAFSPVMEVMSSKNISPWNFDSKNGPAGSHEALDIYRRYAVLHMSLFPYRYAAAQEAAKTGMPILRALVLNYQNDARARTAKDEYLFGPDFLVAPVIDEGTQRPVYLPPGEWVDYWTGKPASGGQVVVADAPVDSIPVWARAGAVVPKIPEDVMTLVPPSESGNTAVKSLDNRRVYEVIGNGGSGERSITDFEGRVVTRAANSNSMKITGGAARVTVRWRFGNVAGATVNGTPATIQAGADGPYIDFDHASASLVEWRAGMPPPAPVVAPVPPPAAVAPVGHAAPAPHAAAKQSKKSTHHRRRARKKKK